MTSRGSAVNLTHLLGLAAEPPDIFMSVDGWTKFWTWVNENQLAATIIGGLILAALLWLLAKLPAVGPHVRHFLKWVWSWRPVTARRYDRDGKQWATQFRALQADLEMMIKLQAKKTAQEVIDKFPEPPDGMRPRKRGGGYVEDTEDNIRAVAEASKPAAPTLPAPLPRWKFNQVGPLEEANWEGTWKFTNLMPKSVALHVRVEAPRGGFRFQDAAFWEDMSGEATGTFRGRVTGIGVNEGVDLTLSWLDETHESHSSTFRIRAPQPSTKWAIDPDSVPF